MTRITDTKEIAKIIRTKLKAEFPDCKFSVTKESYSGGSSIHLSLMESSKVQVIDYDITWDDVNPAIKSGRDASYLENQRRGYHQLNQYQLRDDYKKGMWCNGVFLTEAGHKLLARVYEIANEHNWDNSDPMTDYFDVNYYLHLNIGKWEKPFVDGGDEQ